MGKRGGRVTRAKNIRIAWKKCAVSCAEVGNGHVTSVLQDASPTRLDAGIVSNAFRRDCKYSSTEFTPTHTSAAPLTGQPLPILDQLISPAYVPAKRTLFAFTYTRKRREG